MDNNNLFDIADMEKIQQEIEKDLQAVSPIADFVGSPPPPIPEPIAMPPNDDFWQPPSFIDFYNHANEYESDLSETDMALYDNFYRENIKAAPVSRPAVPQWIYKAAAAIVAAVFVFGALGFGIGAGYGILTRESSESEGNVSNDIVLTSAEYTFENIAEDRDIGTLADIVEALKPSVVGVASHREDGDVRNGSGLIFAENDIQIFIVTNHYVVQGGGNRFEVVIGGAEPVIGRPAGSDSSANLAVLSVEKSQLAAAGIDRIVIATFGDSDQMRVGDTVLAIGNAMGYGNAVTRGVISASEHVITFPGLGHRLSLLQTDAAINYGNSGGPLINTRGEVIGINFDQASAMIFGRTSVEGIGFSISSNIVAPILDELVNGRRPALGIMGGTISESNAAEIGIPPLGVYVSVVLPGRAAYRGGMQESDVITGFNGMQVFNWDQLTQAIRVARIGETVEVRVLRNGTEAITLYIELDVLVVENF